MNRTLKLKWRIGCERASTGTKASPSTSGTQAQITKCRDKGQTRAPEWVHVDRLKELTLKKETVDEAADMAPAKPRSKLWELRMTCGGRGKTRGSRQYRILRDDKSVTWEPEKNLQDAKTALKAWTELSEVEKQTIKSWDSEELWGVYVESSSEVIASTEVQEVNLVYMIYQRADTQTQ